MDAGAWVTMVGGRVGAMLGGRLSAGGRPVGAVDAGAWVTIVGDSVGGAMLGDGLVGGCVGAGLNAKQRVFAHRESPDVVVEVGSAVCRKQRSSRPK